MKKRMNRTFWRYNLDNWPIFIPFIGSITGAIYCANDSMPNAHGMAWFFAGVAIVCVLCSYVDWKRLG